MAELYSALQQFHFLRPAWLLAALPILGALWLSLQKNNDSGDWGKVLSPELATFLIIRPGASSSNLRPWLFAATLISCLALAGPTWSKKQLPAHQRQGALIVLFDLSPSMKASDLAPDRLTRARLKAIDLLDNYREGSAALVAFAGDAHVVSPLTDDAKTIVAQLPVLTPEIMPIAGSVPEEALHMGLELARKAGHRRGDLLLITDGLTRDAQENIRSILGEWPEFRLSILGVGTDEGAPIPLNEQGFARSSRGDIVLARLGSEELAALAARSGGGYRTLTGTDADIQALLAPIKNRAGESTRQLERQLDTWEDRGPWLLLLLLAPTLLLFRRGWVFSFGLMAMVVGPPARAELWDDLWFSADQQGVRALEQGAPQHAQELFKDSKWKGVAAYRAKDFATAADAFSTENTADNHYNQGNALARDGRLKEAIAAYDRALQLAPEMEDAQFNKELVERVLQQQQQKQPEQQNQSEEQAQSEGSNDPSTGEQSSDHQQDANSSVGQGSGSDTDQKEKGDQPSSDQPGDNSPSESKGPGAEDNQSPNSPSEAGDSGPQQATETSSDEPTEPTQGTADTPPDQRSSQPHADEDADEDAPGEGSDALAQSTTKPMSEDERNSAEQWLRRVPDDPGGLLRRKFDYEARQRFREERTRPRQPPGNYSEERW